MSLNKEAYIKAKKDVGLYTDWIASAKKKIDRLEAEIDKEVNCIKTYSTYLTLAEQIIENYELEKEIKKEITLW